MPKGGAAVFTAKVRLPFPKAAAVKYAERILSLVGKKAGGVNILFVNDRSIRRFNRIYRKKDRPTDVLAFETGDIVISTETARRNAGYFGSTAAKELKLYMIHGILHLAGYGDTTAAGRRAMREMEKRLLSRL